jgi:hypothetical protein
LVAKQGFLPDNYVGLNTHERDVLSREQAGAGFRFFAILSASVLVFLIEAGLARWWKDYVAEILFGLSFGFDGWLCSFPLAESEKRWHRILVCSVEIITVMLLAHAIVSQFY